MSKQITTTSRTISTESVEVQTLAAASIAPNTHKAYQTALNRLQAWLAETRQQLNDEVLAQYLTDQHTAGKSGATISQMLAAVKFACKITGETSPAGKVTASVMAGIRRSQDDRGRGQAQAVNWSYADAAAILAENSGESLAGLRDAALISVMSDGLLRVSEAAALTVDDIEAESENTIRIHKSKTDQEAVGTVLYVGDPTIRRLRRWIEAAGITSGAVFVRVLKDNTSVGDSALTTRAIRSIIKSRSADVGVDNASGHSLRIGSAQSLAKAGASVVDMQICGRWASPRMPAHYARGSLAARSAVAKLRYGC